MIKKVLVITFISLLLILYFVFEINKKQPYSWDLNFNGLSKEPFGCFVLRSTLEEKTSIKSFKTTNEALYNLIPKIKNNATTLVIITNNFEPDSIDMAAAYQFVNKGNSIFISSYYFNKRFSDSLNFTIKNSSLSITVNSDTLNLVNPLLHFNQPVPFKIKPSVFTGFDTLNHTILGAYKTKTNYIKIPYGEGSFFIHCQPLVFTNYHLLYSSNDYSYRALSYFKNTNLIWDDYYKPTAGKYSNESSTPFRYLLSQDALRIALYLTLLLITIYFFIESKRKQRFVPIFQPPANSIVKFVATIARLYQGQPDYKNMALKKYSYLREIAYSRYMIRLDVNNPDTAIAFSEKTGYQHDKMKELFSMYHQIESSISINAETLIVFCRQVDDIYELENKN